jgi:hypothetical protein
MMYSTNIKKNSIRNTLYPDLNKKENTTLPPEERSFVSPVSRVKGCYALRGLLRATWPLFPCVVVACPSRLVVARVLTTLCAFISLAVLASLARGGQER